MTQRLKIAALDDDENDLRLLEEHLRSVPGWELAFEGVTDPAALPELLERHAPDVTFLDHHLDSASGLTLLEQIRAMGDQSPIVALTGQADQRVAAQYILSGADAYLMKHDVCPELLRCTVDAVLARRRMQREMAFMEEQLQQARRYEAIGELTQGIAHDFNNMLVSIKGNIELALMEGGSDKVRDFLMRGERTCLVMADLTAVLLRFGRTPRAGRDLVDVGAIVSDLSVLARKMLPETVQLRVEIPDEPLTIEADGSMIRHVLYNLLKNALEAKPRELSLRVRRETDETAIRCQQPGIPAPQMSRDDAVIEVTDDGAGMPPEVRDRAFDPYFSTRGRYDQRGSGLGLAIVWQIVRQHGGAVSLESAEGEGTKVTVRLPPFV